VSGDVLDGTRGLLRSAVSHHHEEHPETAGLPIGDAARATGLDAAQVEALAGNDPDLVVTRGCVRARDHAGTAATSDAGRTLLEAIRDAPFAPPPPDDVALARTLVREGVLVEVGGIYFASEALADARVRVIAALESRGSLTIADAREVLGSTRKYVVPIMNHLDATGVTRRRGDDRIPGPRSGIGAG
jgi:selenocysteine-specific elongation factor